MRCLIILAMAAMLAAPAYAANPNAQASGAPAASAPHKAKAPSAKAPQKAPAETVAKALAAGDKAPANVTGRLVQKVEGKKTRYIFEDNTGRMTVGMGKKAVEQGVPAPGPRCASREPCGRRTASPPSWW